MHNNKLRTVDLTALANCRSLRSLYLDGNALHDKSVVLAPLAACRLLRSLRLGRNRLGGELDISCMLSAAALSTLDVSPTVTLVARITAETSNASSAAAALPPALRRKAASVVWRQEESPPRTPELESPTEAEVSDISGSLSVDETPIVSATAAAVTAEEPVTNGDMSLAISPVGRAGAPPSPPSHSSIDKHMTDSPRLSTDGDAARMTRVATTSPPSVKGGRGRSPHSPRAVWPGGAGGGSAHSASSVSSVGSASAGGAAAGPRKIRFCVLLAGFRGTGHYGVEALLGESADVGTTSVPTAVLESQEALSLVPSHVHVVVVGVEPTTEALIMALRAVDATVPIVIVGRTDASADAASRCLRRGASCFLTQPLSGRDAITVRSLAQKRARSVPSVRPDLLIWEKLRARFSPSAQTKETPSPSPSGLVHIARDIVSASSPAVVTGSAPPPVSPSLAAPSAVTSTPPAAALMASPPSPAVASSPGTSPPPSFGGVRRRSPPGNGSASSVAGHTRGVVSNGRTGPAAGRAHCPRATTTRSAVDVAAAPPVIDFAALRTRALRLAHGGGNSPSGTNLAARARVEESALRMMFSRCGGAAGQSAFPSIATLCGLPICAADAFFHAARRHSSTAAASGGGHLNGFATGGNPRFGGVVRPAGPRFGASLASRSPTAGSVTQVASPDRPGKERVTFAAFGAFWQDQLRERDAETRLFNILRESATAPAVGAPAVVAVVRALVAARQSRMGVSGGGWRSLPTSRSASPVGGVSVSSSSSNLLADVGRGLGSGGDGIGRSAEKALSATEEADIAAALVLYAMRGARWSALRLRDFRRAGLCAGLLSAESGVYAGVTAGLRSDRIAEARRAFAAALGSTDSGGGDGSNDGGDGGHPTPGRVLRLSQMVAYNAQRGLLTSAAVDAVFARRGAPSRTAQRRQRRVKAARAAARAALSAGGTVPSSTIPLCPNGVMGKALLAPEASYDGASPAAHRPAVVPSSVPPAGGLDDQAHLSSSEILSSSDESDPPTEEANCGGGLDIAEFAVFWTATQDASTRSAAEYFFDLLDTDLDGVLSAADAAHFYADKRRLMRADGLEPAAFGDVWHYATDMMLAAVGRAGGRGQPAPGHTNSALPPRQPGACNGGGGRIRTAGTRGGRAGSPPPVPPLGSAAAAATAASPSSSVAGGWPPPRRPGGRRDGLFPPEAPSPPPLVISLPHFRAVAEKDRSDILQALLCREDNGALVDLRKTGERAGTGAAASAEGGGGDAASAGASAGASDGTSCAAAVPMAAAAAAPAAPAAMASMAPVAAAAAADAAVPGGGMALGGVPPDAALANVPVEGV